MPDRKRITRRETVEHLLRRLRPLPGDILLFHHPERFRSAVICFLTASRYYHAGIYAGKGEVIEARLPCVMRRNLFYERDAYRFVVLRAPQRAAGLRALAWAETQVGARYDIRSVVYYALGRILHLPALCRRCTDGRYVCGSFVVQAYRAAGIDLFPGKSPAEIMPASFAALIGTMRRHSSDGKAPRTPPA